MSRRRPFLVAFPWQFACGLLAAWGLVATFRTPEAAAASGSTLTTPVTVADAAGKRVAVLDAKDGKSVLRLMDASSGAAMELAPDSVRFLDDKGAELGLWKIAKDASGVPSAKLQMGGPDDSSFYRLMVMSVGVDERMRGAATVLRVAELKDQSSCIASEIVKEKDASSAQIIVNSGQVVTWSSPKK